LTFKAADIQRITTPSFRTLFRKERAAKRAEELLNKFEEKLRTVQPKAEAAVIREQLNNLKEELDDQVAKAQEMSDKITRETDLVAGLGDKGEQWKTRIAEYAKGGTSVVGAVILTWAFVGYSGPFMRTFREHLHDDIWRLFVVERNMKIQKVLPDVVCYSALMAPWNNQGLPNDHIST
jgi:uncharacterized membrane protein